MITGYLVRLRRKGAVIPRSASAPSVAGQAGSGQDVERLATRSALGLARVWHRSWRPEPSAFKVCQAALSDTLVAKVLVLKYPPFAASQRLQAAARNHRPLGMNERGTAVATFQAGLVQLGFKLPLTLKKGRPDGIYGNETFMAVKSFQSSNHLPLSDGAAGHDTIVLLDDMLAKAAGMSFPIPAGPPSSPSIPTTS